MEAFFRQYAFLIVGSVLGIASLFLFLRRVLPAWRAARMQHTSSPSFSFQLPISALLGFSLGIIVMPFLSEGALLATVFLLTLLSILLGWVLIITNRAVRLAGWQKLVPSRMVKPLPASMVSLALLFLLAASRALPSEFLFSPMANIALNPVRFALWTASVSSTLEPQHSETIMSLTELIKNLFLPTLFAITFAFLGAEVFYQIQGCRLSLGYWFGMLFVYGFVVVPAILRRLSRAKQPDRGSDA